eukprot:CAMPEP_0116889472 /NCGR_PEP_ID=MMETSP0463-20121206/24973_1 /TAXON_ID=181622 /ORGANISM="Strombidinopsis sp, Strain SopsisLIS2011" /LENGTH=59 /DNA_ID=CAMNT_0004556229 /DNA_START=821 /DNA_END=1000 /DNA_ORIENTATION=-
MSGAGSHHLPAYNPQGYNAGNSLLGRRPPPPSNSMSYPVNYSAEANKRMKKDQDDVSEV